MNDDTSRPAPANETGRAGHSAAARDETGTDTDVMPPPLGGGRSSVDTGGQLHTLPTPAAAEAADAGEGGLASDAGGALAQHAAAQEAADAPGDGLHADSAAEQLARPEHGHGPRRVGG